MPPMTTQKHAALRWCSSLVIAYACAACSNPKSRVMLLPQEDGRASAVVVTSATTTAVLSAPYSGAEVGSKGSLTQVQSNESEVRERYPALLALKPPNPDTYTLNFQPGTSDLTAESIGRLDQIIAAARARAGGEIVIVGHTDREGAADANDALSLQRANAIRDVLILRGFQSELIEPVGRGERDPVVPTEDNVPEPRNRRADIIVR